MRSTWMILYCTFWYQNLGEWSGKSNACVIIGLCTSWSAVSSHHGPVVYFQADILFISVHQIHSCVTTVATSSMMAKEGMHSGSVHNWANLIAEIFQRWCQGWDNASLRLRFINHTTFRCAISFFFLLNCCSGVTVEGLFCCLQLRAKKKP